MFLKQCILGKDGLSGPPSSAGIPRPFTLGARNALRARWKNMVMTSHGGH